MKRVDRRRAAVRHPRNLPLSPLRMRERRADGGQHGRAPKIPLAPMHKGNWLLDVHTR
jgi:hypothetical protein